MTQVFKVLVTALLIGLPGTKSAMATKYVQTSCDISPPSYAVIWMVESDKVSVANAWQYSIQFSPKNMAVRFPPNYYSLRWEKSIVSVRFDSIVEKTGLIYLKVLQNGKVLEERLVGRIEASCWKKVKAFVEEFVVKDGVEVRLEEEFGPEKNRPT